MYLCSINSVGCTWLPVFVNCCVCVCACCVRCESGWLTEQATWTANGLILDVSLRLRHLVVRRSQCTQCQTKGDGSRWLFFRFHAPGPSISLCCAAFQPDRLSLCWACCWASQEIWDILVPPYDSSTNETNINLIWKRNLIFLLMEMTHST